MRKLMAGVVAGLMIAASVLAAEPVELAAIWNPSGEPPDGCSSGLTGRGVAPKWAILEVDDEGGRGVAETSADATDDRFPLCIVDGPAYGNLENVDVTVRFRPVAGKVDRAGGIAVRVKDERNYYVVRANALEDNVRLYSVVDGDRQLFAGRNIKVESGKWHTLGLKAVGDRFVVSYDGVEIFGGVDRRIAGPGRVALWSKADSVTEFVDLRIERLP